MEITKEMMVMRRSSGKCRNLVHITTTGNVGTAICGQSITSTYSNRLVTWQLTEDNLYIIDCPKCLVLIGGEAPPGCSTLTKKGEPCKYPVSADFTNKDGSPTCDRHCDRWS